MNRKGANLIASVPIDGGKCYVLYVVIDGQLYETEGISLQHPSTHWEALCSWLHQHPAGGKAIYH